MSKLPAERYAAQLNFLQILTEQAKKKDGVPGSKEVVLMLLAVASSVKLAQLHELNCTHTDFGDKAMALLRSLEFGIYEDVGGRRGAMCGICYRFEREGHQPDCYVGKRMKELRDIHAK